MAGTVTFAGVGSGIDVNALITGLTAVEQQPISAEKSKAASYRAAVSSLSDVGNLLAKLKTATAALDTAQEVGSNTATSSGTAVAVTANGAAQPGSYDVTVEQLAQEQRTYSNDFASASDALGLSGPLKIGVGAGAQASIDVTASDNLNSLADKINAAGIRASASVFYDGSRYRLQVRGLDTGDANNLTFDESSVSLGLSVTANTKQKAQSAIVDIDGYQVKSQTNQVSGAIQGVTLAVTAKTTTDPVHVTVASDPNALGDKIQGVVDAYNAVVNKIHSLAGQGSTAGANPVLNRDSTLRGIADRLSSTLLGTVGTGKYQSLGSIGVNLQNDGTLLLDRTKLGAAMQSDPKALQTVLAGTNGQNGLMSLLGSLADNITDPKSGSLQAHEDGLSRQAASMDDDVARKTARLQAYSDLLQKQFTAMDTTVAGYQAQLSQLSVKA
jgi:flagellar hook-associated protein 2